MNQHYDISQIFYSLNPLLLATTQFIEQKSETQRMEIQSQPQKDEFDPSFF